MKPLIIIAAFLALLIGLALAFPDRLLSPGHLMQGHAKIEKQCFACHKPFRGALAVQCASCHKPGDIGIRRVDGTALPEKAGKALFHRGVPASSCLECHADHKGGDAKKALRAFRHESLGANLRANCNTCHDGQKPRDKLHVSATRSCGDCHATHGWRPASFDHQMLTTRQSCIGCHKGELPTGGLHANAGTSCATCHGTNAWKPASFDHDRYFRLDRDHRASCKTCHSDPANFRQYTCYGCHEHTPSNIASEHIEEGIQNYRNCAKCHKSSRDGD